MNNIKLPITNTYKNERYIPCVDELRFVTIITVHDAADIRHLDIFLENNPNTDVYIISDNRPDIPDVCGSYKWKNNDVVLRNWWQVNREKIKVNKIFYMEWDVLVLIKLTDNMFSTGVRSSQPFEYPQGLSADESWANAYWFWGEDGDKLPKKLKQKACNSMSVCMWIDSAALDYLIDPIWDEVYMSDIVADIRLHTILNYNNVLLEDCKDLNINIKISCHLAFIEDDLEIIKQIQEKVPGIYHPVKKRIDQY